MIEKHLLKIEESDFVNHMDYLIMHNENQNDNVNEELQYIKKITLFIFKIRNTSSTLEQFISDFQYSNQSKNFLINYLFLCIQCQLHIDSVNLIKSRVNNNISKYY